MANFQIKDFTSGLAVKIRAFLVNTDENVAVHSLVDTANGEILGTKTDAAATQTDSTALSFMSVLKQISKSLQSVLNFTPAPATSGGLALLSFILASGTNANSVKGSAGQLYKIEAFNNSATPAYLKLYNTAGTPTAGAGTPVSRYMIPANGGFATTVEMGDAYASGIGFTCTGGIADNDTTSIAASTLLVNFHYK